MARSDALPGWLARWFGRWRRPAVPQWLDLSEGEADNGHGKEALKAIVARKRRNELVRNREFERLRQLSQRRPHGDTAPGAAHLSFFRDSLLPQQDERERTLRKIDEIEAQMSRQWWQAAPSGAAASAGSDAHRDGLPPDARPAPAGPDDGPVTQAAVEFAPTRMTTAAPDAPWPDSALIGADRARWGARPPLSATTSQPDADLAEAALCWARGDASAAVAGLRGALRARHEDEDARCGVLLAALLDVCRMTGQRGEFDSAQAEFAGPLRRAPVSWRPAAADGMPQASITLRAGPGPTRGELGGELLGDVSAVLQQLDAGGEPARRLTLSCARLGRVDLAAAGCLLNWLAARQEQVELHDVSPITVALFTLLGLDGHARVVAD